MQELLTFHRRFLRGSVLAIFLAFSVVFIVLFVFVLCLVYTMLPVSLDYPLVIIYGEIPFKNFEISCCIDIVLANEKCQDIQNSYMTIILLGKAPFSTAIILLLYRYLKT